MAENPYHDAPPEWRDLAPLGSRLWVLTVKLMDEYVEAWDRLVEDREDVVRAELQRLKAGEPVGDQGIREALEELARDFFLRGPGPVDPHDVHDEGAWPQETDEPHMNDGEPEHPAELPKSERAWAGWRATLRLQDEGLSAIAKRLSPVGPQHQVRNRAGIMLDEPEQRYVRVLVDLEASETSLKDLMHDMHERHMQVSETARGVESRRKGLSRDKKMPWEQTLRTEKARRESELREDGRAPWRIYAELNAPKCSKDTGKKSISRIKGAAARLLSLEEERLSRLRAMVEAAREEIEAPSLDGVFLYEHWILASLPPSTRQTYAMRLKGTRATRRQ